MMVRPQLAWLVPIHFQVGASNTSRTNHPMTKLCVIRSECRSSMDGVIHSAIASVIWAWPASICASDTEPKNGWKAAGMSGVGPEGMQSNSRTDNIDLSDG